jgi:RNase P subunit RPR2
MLVILPPIKKHLCERCHRGYLDKDVHVRSAWSDEHGKYIPHYTCHWCTRKYLAAEGNREREIPKIPAVCTIPKATR